MSAPTTRQRVRAIHAELTTGDTYAYLRLGNTTGDGIRIMRARGRQGNLEVRSLNTGDWIPTDAADRIEITDAAGRVFATYQGGRA
jgi:hypothetical protein